MSRGAEQGITIHDHVEIKQSEVKFPSQMLTRKVIDHPKWEFHNHLSKTNTSNLY